jgi:hypothetical protein
MASFNAAGYISFKPAVGSSASMNKAFAAPHFRPDAGRETGSCPIGEMSTALNASAIAANRLDLENLHRRIGASRQLKDTIVSLKDRLARRVMMRAPFAVGDDSVELVFKAS